MAVLKVRVTNKSSDDIVVKLIHLQRNTEFGMGPGQKVIFDPGRGFGFLSGDRVVASWDGFNEKVKAFNKFDIQQNFTEIFINANSIVLAFDPGIDDDATSGTPPIGAGDS
jgi:hypothetical protein